MLISLWEVHTEASDTQLLHRYSPQPHMNSRQGQGNQFRVTSGTSPNVGHMQRPAGNFVLKKRSSSNNYRVDIGHFHILYRQINDLPLWNTHNSTIL